MAPTPSSRGFHPAQFPAESPNPAEFPHNSRNLKFVSDLFSTLGGAVSKRFLLCAQGRPESIEISVAPHGGIRRRCSRCQRPAPGYDCLPERRWLFVPLWGIPTYFCYAPRRVECAEHGVVVEHI